MSALVSLLKRKLALMDPAREHSVASNAAKAGFYAAAQEAMDEIAKQPPASTKAIIDRELRRSYG